MASNYDDRTKVTFRKAPPDTRLTTKVRADPKQMDAFRAALADSLSDESLVDLFLALQRKEGWGDARPEQLVDLRGYVYAEIEARDLIEHAAAEAIKDAIGTTADTVGESDAIPNTYDAVIFQPLGELYKIPWPFLKVLSWHESRFKADARPIGPDGKALSTAVGFFQPLHATVDLYNKESGAAVKLSYEDMLDPWKNGLVGAWLVSRIVKEYNESKAQGIAPPNWEDAIYAGLVALGYVAGWSRNQGVAYLATKITGDVTPKAVRAVAMRDFPKSTIYSNGAGYMSDPKLMEHVEKIARDYGQMIGAVDKRPVADKAEDRPLPKPKDKPKEGLLAMAEEHPLLTLAAIALGIKLIA